MREHLFRFIRRTPRTTQQCRDELHRSHQLSSIEAEELLAELRDQGEIAFANGRWYSPDDQAPAAKPKGPQAVHPKQLPLFADASGRRLTEHEQMLERINGIARAVRG